MEPVLQLDGVSKTYATSGGPCVVLRGVRLAVARGDFVAVTGPSGAGKSTLLNLCTLLDQPTAGVVRFEGEDVAALPDERRCAIRRQKIGMIFQRFCLLPHRSALDNVRFRFRHLPLPAAEERERARRALERVGLADRAGLAARLLSGGEMQRVAIARAIAQEPVLLAADEPTGNLDAAAARAVMDCFRDLNATGITILLATHNLALLPYCRRRLRCADGNLVEDGP